MISEMSPERPEETLSGSIDRQIHANKTDVEAARTPRPEEEEEMSFDDHIYHFTLMDQLGEFFSCPTRQLWLELSFLLAIGTGSIMLFFFRPLYREWAQFELWIDDSGMLHFPKDLAHQPFEGWLVSPWVLGPVTVFVPIIVFSVMQKVQEADWSDFRAAIMGSIIAQLSAMFLHLFIKFFVPAPRPYFLRACNVDLLNVPILAPTQILTSLFQNFTICKIERASNALDRLRANEIERALQSFPSGHATSAFSSFFFVSLYLAGKTRSPDFIRYPLLFIPMIPAVFLAASVVIDHHHHPTDAIAGALLGSICAFLSYRSYFGTVQDEVGMDKDLPLELGGR